MDYLMDPVGEALRLDCLMGPVGRFDGHLDRGIKLLLQEGHPQESRNGDLQSRRSSSRPPSFHDQWTSRIKAFYGWQNPGLWYLMKSHYLA